MILSTKDDAKLAKQKVSRVVCLKLRAVCAVVKVSTDIKGSMSFITEALLDRPAKAAMSVWL